MGHNTSLHCAMLLSSRISIFASALRPSSSAIQRDSAAAITAAFCPPHRHPFLGALSLTQIHRFRLHRTHGSGPGAPFGRWSCSGSTRTRGTPSSSSTPRPTRTATEPATAARPGAPPPMGLILEGDPSPPEPAGQGVGGWAEKRWSNCLRHWGHRLCCTRNRRRETPPTTDRCAC